MWEDNIQYLYLVIYGSLYTMRKFNIWGTRLPRDSPQLSLLPATRTTTRPWTNILENKGHGNLEVCSNINWSRRSILLPQVQHKDSSIRGWSSNLGDDNKIHIRKTFSSNHLVSLGVPADLKDPPSSLVWVHKLPVLGAPDVDTPNPWQGSVQSFLSDWKTLYRKSGYLSKKVLSDLGNFAITCRSCRWRGISRRGRTPRCRPVPCAWVGGSIVISFYNFYWDCGECASCRFKRREFFFLLRCTFFCPLLIWSALFLLDPFLGSSL